MCETSYDEFPYGLAVRIPGFHPGGPGSTPGMEKHFNFLKISLYTETWKRKRWSGS